jgi:hypothetical protein
MSQKPAVFIHTNDKQILGALVGMYSMKKASRYTDSFDVKLIRLEETPHLMKRQGQRYLRKGKTAVWLNEDLQSFSPLRRMVPQLMGFNGRAVVTDPDVFAIGDIYDLLTMDMDGKAVMCRNVSDGYKGNGHSFYASSVMLLDCSRLTHWRWDEDIDQMFEGKLDYGPWIGLKTENSGTIGEIGEEWNSFDKLTPDTKLLHTTERSTQPWRTGLPIDFDLTTRGNVVQHHSAAQTKVGTFVGLFARMFMSGSNEKPTEVERYRRHPDPAQEKLFFELLRGAIEAGYVDKSLVKQRMAENDVRKDAFELLEAAGLHV